MHIIAFGHKSNVGKNTCAKLMGTILKDRGAVVCEGSFAYELKLTCHRLYRHLGLQPPEYYERYRDKRHIKLPVINKTPVEIWIAFGNAIRHSVYPDTWTDVAVSSGQGYDVLLITDLRTPDEVLRLREIGATLVKVTRKSSPVLEGGIDGCLDGYTGWDYTIDNDGSEHDLIKPLCNIIAEVKHQWCQKLMEESS